MLSSKLLAVNRWHTSRDTIDQRFFLLTLLIAVGLHAAGVYIWSLMPKAAVENIPVRVLNIKLSDGDNIPAPEPKAVQPDTSAAAKGDSAVSSLSHYQNKENARQQSVAESMDKAMADLSKNAAQQAALPPVALTKPLKPVVKGKFNIRSEGTKTAAPVFPVTTRQYVRDDQLQAMTGSTTQNSAGHSKLSSDKVVARYAEVIALWVQKFKVYPAKAKKKGMVGETAVHIRIDRQGNILYYALERSTGHTLLDHAAIDMIRRADPVPAVPGDYPAGDVLEFLIPVSFRLEP